MECQTQLLPLHLSVEITVITCTSSICKDKVKKEKNVFIFSAKWSHQLCGDMVPG